MVIEKPFGHDLDSARELNRQVNAVFHESQVFRIDHYLGKETVQNILVFRFANGIFEPIWNRNYIDHVQITAAETLGIEGRGPFYEKAGALRDVVQNHVMELLSFVAMEPPSSFDAEAVRREKVKVWRAIPPIPILNAVRGQYGPGIVEGQRVIGYRDEERVNPESGTETYAAVRLQIENWRWAGVPFYLRAGKRLKKRATEISIQFKQPPLLIFNRMTGSGACQEIQPNLLTIRIQPDEGIALRFGAKVPTTPNMDVCPVNMDFDYAAAFGKSSANGYERLLLDAMLGDQTLFSHRDGVEINWALYTPIHRSLGGEEPGGLSQLLCRNLGAGVLGSPAGARRPRVEEQSGTKGLRQAEFLRRFRRWRRRSYCGAAAQGHIYSGFALSTGGPAVVADHQARYIHGLKVGQNEVCKALKIVIVPAGVGRADQPPAAPVVGQNDSIVSESRDDNGCLRTC